MERRGRPPKSAEERREIRFQIRLSEEELRQIERAAGGKASTWARDVLLKESKRIKR